jgi:hypothetical protein
MKETINVYNHFHNGDIFYSRMLINGLIKKFDINFYHNLTAPLLSDIDGLTEIVGIPPNFNIHTNDLQNKNVNAWMGQQNMIFVNTSIPGCSFENYFEIVKLILNNYEIDIELDEEFYLPTINKEKIFGNENITTFMENLKLNYNKIILLSNGNVNSGQSVNVDLTNLITRLSDKHPDKVFLVTQDILTNNTNIINTSSITKVQPDLLQISLISSFCDIIVGRASGPYCFTHTKENLLDPNKTYISFSNNVNEGVWYKNTKATQKWSPDFNIENMYSLINNELNK